MSAGPSDGWDGLRTSREGRPSGMRAKSRDKSSPYSRVRIRFSSRLKGAIVPNIVIEVPCRIRVTQYRTHYPRSESSPCPSGSPEACCPQTSHRLVVVVYPCPTLSGNRVTVVIEVYIAVMLPVPLSSSPHRLIVVQALHSLRQSCLRPLHCSSCLFVSLLLLLLHAELPLHLPD